MTTAYTVGYEAGYDAAIVSKAPRRPIKTGMGTSPRHHDHDGEPPPVDYIGGSVWRTAAEAAEVARHGVFLSELNRRASAGVYELALPGTWDECTHVVAGHTHLRVDAEIVGKVLHDDQPLTPDQREAALRMLDDMVRERGLVDDAGEY